ncbi:MAG: riboflavin synthase [Eubacteriaceae bacterium]|nr:riboflavin synthase [Eubacteriaceae bacterium]
MFTGIIEEIGAMRHVVQNNTSGEIAVKANTVLEGTKIGDSIAVNGVCLTVTSMQSDGFTADVMPETLRYTNLGDLKTGDPVNLERAMAADGRFGGHMVAGHSDGTGKLSDIKKEGNAVWLTIDAAPGLMRYIVAKGSVALDGVSLTVAEAEKDRFKVSIIPHTGAETTLLTKRLGSRINIENDLVGKYVEKLLTPQAEAKSSSPSPYLTLEYLEKNGF